MAPQSRTIPRSSHHALEIPTPQSKTLATRASDFRDPIYHPGKRYRQGAVTSSLTRVEHVTTISPLNRPKVLLVGHDNKNEHSASGEITFVPNPVPDTGLRPTEALSTAHPVVTVYSSLLVHLPSTDLKPGFPLSTFMPLPPLLSVPPTPTIKSSSSPMTTFSSFSEPPKASATTSDHGTSHQPPKLSTPIIILLAVGSGLLLVGIVIIIKFCARPTRRARPTPSLPILNDSFSDYNEYQTKESPIFGGPEKISPLPGNNNGVWSWTQYTQAEQAVPNHKSSPPRPQEMPHLDYPGRTHYPFVGYAHASSGPLQSRGSSLYLPAMQQARRPAGSADRRSSAPSMSPYFSSPRNSLGTAIESRPVKALAIDRHRDVQRTGRKDIPEAYGTYPIHVEEKKRSSQGLAYDGAVVSSPICVPCVVPHPISAPNRGGRTRIKSTYFAPGSYPRMSNLPPKAYGDNGDRSNPTDLPRKPFIQKSESRRDQDTQALTYALGLSSPAPDYDILSPQPTLYPDDSLSVVESRSPKMQSRKNQASSEDRPSLPKIDTEEDGSAALGSLMLMDFGAELAVKKGASSSKPLGGAVPTTASLKLARGPSKKTALRNDEKPPHIPLPPPMPSLAQMALEHANPQAYDDYKSPTYSIYGFYEHERKSGSGY